MFKNRQILEWQNLERHSLWLFERHKTALTPDEITGSNFLVAVSMKNPRFSKRWLEVVSEDIKHFSGRLYLTLADTPYFENELAIKNIDQSLEERIAALTKIRDEQYSRLVHFAEERDFVQWLDWRAVTRETPAWLRSEIERAFSNRGYFYSCVLEQVRRVFPSKKLEREAAAFGRFLIDEIPTLIYLYYEVIEGCIDVYPGPQAKLFWLLESGEFADELPDVTEYVRQSGPHTYANVSLTA